MPCTQRVECVDPSRRDHIRLRRAATVALAVLTVGVPAIPALASTAVANMAVTATVQATCLNSITPMGFGTYTGVVATSTATVTVTCTTSTGYTVSLNAGTSTGATVTTRAMTAGAVKLNYVLTTDAGHLTNWGSTIGTDTVAGTGNSAANNLWASLLPVSFPRLALTPIPSPQP